MQTAQTHRIPKLRKMKRKQNDEEDAISTAKIVA